MAATGPRGMRNGGGEEMTAFSDLTKATVPIPEPGLMSTNEEKVMTSHKTPTKRHWNPNR